jgi:hypothetical protein
MRRFGGLFVLLVALVPGSGSAQTGAETSRTFAAPADRVWVVSESILRSLGWDIDQSDRAVGWILTDSRAVDFKDYGVYGKGLRHKLRLTLKAAGEGRTTVSVERELYTEERILWMTERKPVSATDRNVEAAILDAIEKAL